MNHLPVNLVLVSRKDTRILDRIYVSSAIILAWPAKALKTSIALLVRRPKIDFWIFWIAAIVILDTTRTLLIKSANSVTFIVRIVSVHYQRIVYRANQRRFVQLIQPQASWLMEKIVFVTSVTLNSEIQVLISTSVWCVHQSVILVLLLALICALAA
jgi:hypothetical protein